jgi:protein SCO1/2
MQSRILSLKAGLYTLAVVTALVFLALSGTRPGAGTLPFPARELRTTLVPPPIHLTDQVGQPVDLVALKGKVVMLTAVYASCPHACPLILAEARRVVAELSPRDRADLQVIAVTIDPAHDDRAALARLAKLHGLEPPLWHLVTGEIPEVERTLDRMNIARKLDPKTGIIDHANLLMLIDRQGRLAYRFTMGPKQEPWLGAAIRLLLRESARPAA